LRGPAVSHDLRTAEIWIGDRQRDERDPRPQAAQCRHHEVHRIADQQGDPIPGLDAFLEQAGGHSPSCGAQLAPGQRAIQVFDSGPIRGSIGMVQHRTEHAVVRHAFSQVLHARYCRSHIEWNSRRGGSASGGGKWDMSSNDWLERHVGGATIPAWRSFSRWLP
jgi:hypothetical protein